MLILRWFIQEHCISEVLRGKTGSEVSEKKKARCETKGKRKMQELESGGKQERRWV